MVVVVSNSCRVTDISKGVCITSFTFNDMTLALAFMTRFLSHPSQLGQLRLTLRRRMVFGVPGVSAISVGEVHVMVTRSMRRYDADFACSKHDSRMRTPKGYEYIF